MVRELHSLVLSTIEQLPQALREATLLNYYESLALHERAAITSASPGANKVRPMLGLGLRPCHPATAGLGLCDLEREGESSGQASNLQIAAYNLSGKSSAAQATGPYFILNVHIQTTETSAAKDSYSHQGATGGSTLDLS